MAKAFAANADVKLKIVVGPVARLRLEHAAFPASVPAPQHHRLQFALRHDAPGGRQNFFADGGKTGFQLRASVESEARGLTGRRGSRSRGEWFDRRAWDGHRHGLIGRGMLPLEGALPP